MILFVVGNKVDCPKREVTISDIDPLKRKHSNIEYFEVSAQTGDGVDKMFDRIV
jgi:predicted GTPase